MPLYSRLIRPLLFRLDPETAHHGSIQCCRLAGALPAVPRLTRACLHFTAPQLRSVVAGIPFDNPVGLAAGWDKSGRALRMLECLGFGFAEIGSISAEPSAGNPAPRLFRLPQDRGIIVNYGLPNDGAEVVARRLAAHRRRAPLGVNIVKTNKGHGAACSSDEEILADYVRSVSLLHRHATYLTLNLSCPNAAGGKDFFALAGSIRRLLERLQPLQIACPVFLKLAPSDDPAEQERILSEVDAFRFVRGFIFNLPAGKPDSLRLSTPRQALGNQPGAVAGKPVEALINRCIAALAARMDTDRYVIIGAGGIWDAEDAYLKIRLGASLVQLYSAMIYEGPGVVKRINQGLCQLLARDGFGNVSEAVGADQRRAISASHISPSTLTPARPQKTIESPS